ncbi:MAG: GAF domain-containing protein [Deltaproteobacteria bacterium]|nr:GAF domain-containing protein [Candidatus Zymogenaceae bacterium]
MRFSELAHFAVILNSSLDAQTVKERAIEAVDHLMECEVGSLLLLDEQTQELYFEVALGEKGDAVKTIRLKPGEGIAGWVAEHNEPLLINEVKQDSRHSQRADDTSQFRTRNMVCVPLVVKDEIIGVLQAINKTYERNFTEDDLSLLVSLSHQVAIAVDNARLYEELRETFFQTVEALADAIEKRDPYTGDHTKRVMQYSMAVITQLSINQNDEENLRLASILHDVGKIGIEDSILRKDTMLSDSEFDIIKEHPETGATILGHIKMLKDAIPGIMHHHERMDGTGYPLGLTGGDIPLIARIIAVVDTFDAMTTDRPYRKAMDDRDAIEELRRFSGTQFDAHIVDAFISAYNKGLVR